MSGILDDHGALQQWIVLVKNIRKGFDNHKPVSYLKTVSVSGHIILGNNLIQYIYAYTHGSHFQFGIDYAKLNSV